jgi:hypothetical protein
LQSSKLRIKGSNATSPCSQGSFRAASDDDLKTASARAFAASLSTDHHVVRLVPIDLPARARVELNVSANRQPFDSVSDTLVTIDEQQMTNSVAFE